MVSYDETVYFAKSRTVNDKFAGMRDAIVEDEADTRIGIGSKSVSPSAISPTTVRFISLVSVLKDGVSTVISHL